LPRIEGGDVTVLRSNSLEAAFNLAVEELLLAGAEDHAPALFLWRSGPAVVIGKNQNPWRECRTDRLAADGIGLVRRVSGGGAVYHDEGNLNFTLVLRRGAYSEARQFAVVRRALRDLGVEAHLLNRNSLAVGGRKVSGSAFCFRGDGALHHGTLLVDADLARLETYLGPSVAGYRTHAISSAPMPVANLSASCPGLDWNRAADTLEAAFRAEYGLRTPAVEPARLGLAELDALRAKHASSEWRLGRTPAFTAVFGFPYRGDSTSLELEVAKGRVTRVGIGGAAEPALTAAGAALAGCRYDAPELADRLEADAAKHPVLAAARACLQTQPFRWV
jgi:lipoate-protein ligase A